MTKMVVLMNNITGRNISKIQEAMRNSNIFLTRSTFFIVEIFHSFYEGSSHIELPTDTTIESNDETHDEGDEDKALTEKREIPRMYKKNAIPRMYKKSAIPRMYKRSVIPRMYRRSGSVPRLYKRSEFGVPRMYKRDGENADVGTYEIYRRDQMPRLHKKSGVDAESNEGSNDIQWLRQVRNSAIPRHYKKSIPRM